MPFVRQVFAAFASEEILRESGRLPYALLYAFVAAGFDVRVCASLGPRLSAFYRSELPDLPDPARQTLSMPGVTFTDCIPANPGDFTYLFDDSSDSTRRLPWGRRVKVSFDLFSPFLLQAPLIAPYPMHPVQTQWATKENLAGLRCAPRGMRVFFAGDSKGYVRNRVRYPGPKLPRLEVLNTLKERMPGEVVTVTGADHIAQLCASGYANKFVLSDSGSGIEPTRWLPTLAQADFFLCPPGIVMPMCHNVIEAMAVGTIPLISYPEWFHPNLEHMRNCIAFDGKDDLVAKMRLALEMPASQIAKMRAQVVEYYESHLRPEVLVRALESRPERDLTLLLYTELNMARNASKLNRNSVLIRGPVATGPLRWLGAAIDRHRGRLAGI